MRLLRTVLGDSVVWNSTNRSAIRGCDDAERVRIAAMAKPSRSVPILELRIGCPNVFTRNHPLRLASGTAAVPGAQIKI